MEVAKLLTVFGLGAVELWAAIPAGLAFRLHPVLIGITSASGAILAVVVVVLLGERLRGWLLRHYPRMTGSGQHGHVYKVWQRYGVIGVGLLAPLLTGAPFGAALGLALGAPAGRLLLWMLIGVVLWSALLTAIGALGLAGIRFLWH